MVKSASSRQPGKNLITSAKDTHTNIIRPVKSFVLKSNVEFASRSLNVFNKLNVLETNHQTWMSANETHDSFDPGNDVRAPVAGDVFKKPFAPVCRKRKNNHFPFRTKTRKWIRYSLEDVQLSSDATNTAVALAFLHDLRKKNEVESSSQKEVSRKRSFKPSYTRPLTASSNQDLEYHSQPEKICAQKSDSNIKLPHLQEDFDGAYE